MNFSDKLAADRIRVDFAADGKTDALRKIAALAATAPLLKDVGEARLYNLLAEREATVSTGLGNGIAIPHARVEGLSDFVIFVLIAPKGIDFNALDGRKVQIFFTVFAPAERINDQLKILATISRTLAQSGFKKELLRTTTPEVLHEVIARATEDGPGTATGGGDRRKLLFIILYYEDDLRAVLEYLIDQGIEGATILNSKGMGSYVSAMPLFAGFLGFMREDRNISYTVMTLISASREKAIISGIERITGDLDKRQGAMAISLDVAFCKGTMNMI